MAISQKRDIKYFLLYLRLEDGAVFELGDHHIAVKLELSEVGREESLGQGLLRRVVCVTHILHLNNHRDIIIGGNRRLMFSSVF